MSEAFETGSILRQRILKAASNSQKTMKMMKAILASLAGMAVLGSASAAVITFAQSGFTTDEGATSFSLSFNLSSFSGAGPYHLTSLDGISSVNFQINGNTPVSFTPDTIVITFTMSSATTGSLDSGSEFSFINLESGLGISAREGQTGFFLADWAPSSGNPEDGVVNFSPSVTAVPEPETYAAVAGAGLVASGLFRRRAARA